MTRQTKTPAQRAQEAHDVEQRRVTKLGKKIADLKAELRQVEAEGDAAKKRLAYLAQNPDLPKQPGGQENADKAGAS